ncbi:hypothetical protein [Streptomyces achromogenes]|uniref:hypothetical protein n=1 Tax=Streptomyces achromogenes TaxID=67255 RepID=UPI0004C68B16|nr:hypothetical protein [Streptomyces achromogenes]
MTTPETFNTVIAAGPILGSVGTSGLTLTTGMVMLAGLRGSDRVKLDRDKAGGIGIALGTFGGAAGDLWADLTSGVAEVPTSLIQGTFTGNMGLGGVALALTGWTFLFKWRRLIWPSLLGISAGVVYGQAGGIWAIGHNLVLRIASAVGAM